MPRLNLSVWENGSISKPYKLGMLVGIGNMAALLDTACPSS